MKFNGLTDKEVEQSRMTWQKKECQRYRRKQQLQNRIVTFLSEKRLFYRKSLL